MTSLHTTPTDTDLAWQQYWAAVGNEDWLAAKRLLDLSARVQNFFHLYLRDVDHAMFDEVGNELDNQRRELVLDWDAAAASIASDGFSSTERRLAQLVAALTTGEPLELTSLTRMGSWTVQVWTILLDWGTEGAATLNQLDTLQVLS